MSAGDYVSAAVKKVVFYIIKRDGSPIAVRTREDAWGSPAGTFSEVVIRPTRFASVTDALAAITFRGQVATMSRELPLSIVRVEEVPGSEERVVLGETQEAPAGSVVKYAIYGQIAADYVQPEGSYRWNDLSTAALFTNHTEAIERIVLAKGMGLVTIKRIAVQPSTPKYIETVLA